MPLSPTVTATAAPAGRSPDRAPGTGHIHAEGRHADHSHADHAHAHRLTHAPSVSIGPSMLRLSLGARLLLAGGFLAALWTAVALVVGVEP